MWKNHLKIALRSLSKQWKYGIIKIGGFALSIAACLLILFYVLHENSFDKSYPDGDQIYRLVGEAVGPNGDLTKGTSFPAPMADMLQETFPEIEVAGRLLPNPLFGAGSNQISTENDRNWYYEEGFTFADQKLLNMLAPKFIYGDPASSLSKPMTLVISRSKAEQFFPGENPIGKQFYVNNKRSNGVPISGVVEDMPENSHLYGIHYFISLENMHFYDGEQDNWMASNYVIYLKIRQGSDIPVLENRLRDAVVDNYIIPAFKASGRPVPAQIGSTKLHLQPIADIHLQSYDISEYTIFSETAGDKRLVWLFVGTAAFILGIACINFVNLSIARANHRAKEISMRKVVGSTRQNIIAQFLAESVVYSFFAVAIGALLAWILLPFFNHISGQSIDFPWLDWWLAPLLLSSSLLVGLLAGMYPAFILSSFQPIQVLKGVGTTNGKSPLLRNALVVFQFSVSIVLIIATLVIHYQTEFILTRKVGFDREQVLVLDGTNSLGEQLPAFKTELKRSSAVRQVSIGDYLPVHTPAAKRNGNPMWLDGKKDTEQPAQSQLWEVDEDYLETMGMQLVAGRNFDKNKATDDGSVIINEQLAQDLQLSEPIGAKITEGWNTFTVIGVVGNFDFESVKDSSPSGLVLTHRSSPNMVSIKLSGRDVAAGVKEVERIWKQFAPHQAIRYSFLDEQFTSMYASVQQTRQIFSVFAGLAIFIACLGLFGLAAFITEQRTREIGIRKVLGAKVITIIQSIIRGFAGQVALAFLIASPLAWWGMNLWLDDYAYHIDIAWWMFAIAGALAILVAMATISYQALRAASANPIKSLRNE